MSQVQGRAFEQLVGPDQPLTNWTASQAASLTSSVVQTSHRLAELDLFSDASLAAVLDRLPRQRLQVFTMGTDPNRPADWTPVEVGDASGADILAAVREGRLFVNARLIDRDDREFEMLRDGLFDEIARFRQDLVPGSPSLTLLITSPKAVVYYHLDSGPNMLWHVRGEKRVFVYPATNDFFVERADLEDVFAGVREEFLPYRPDFDDAALKFDLEPGELIAWPQNAPHRITNSDSMNISLSGEFDTRNSFRRHLVYTANRFFSRRLHLPMHSTRETGVASATKRLSYRACRKAGLDSTQLTHDYVTRLQLDPASPGRLVTLPQPVRAAFSVG
ncbi:MAG TPA: hypothetical protein VGO38_03395 [Acidimicrobiia bacterium]